MLFGGTMQRSPAAIVARVLLSAALAVAAVGFVGELRVQESSCTAAPPDGAPVLAWRLGTPPVERLRSFLDDAHRLLPRGAIVGFASREGPVDAPFFRRLWAAYLQPDLNWVSDADAKPYTHYVLAYEVRLDRPGMSLVQPLAGGCHLRI